MQFFKNFTLLILFLFLAIILSCKKDNAKNIKLKDEPCTENIGEVKLRYFDHIIRDHTVVIENFELSCINQYNFIELAYKYNDSTNLKSPIRSITFIADKADLDYEMHRDEKTDYELENRIVSVIFDDNPMGRVPELSEIRYYIDNKQYTFDFSNYKIMDLLLRRKAKKNSDTK